MEAVTVTLNDDGKIEDVDFVAWIMNEIADKVFTRKDVAATYSILLQKETPTETLAKVNRAIIDRWSPAALRWVKEQAWKQANASVVTPKDV